MKLVAVPHFFNTVTVIQALKEDSGVRDSYIIRIYQDMVNTYSQNMVGGMLGLLRYCPQEVAHLRKELLIAARHILATDLRKSKQVL